VYPPFWAAGSKEARTYALSTSGREVHATGSTGSAIPFVPVCDLDGSAGVNAPERRY
jgi:hypothetical protein